jgi:hypothetical protein
MLTYEEVEHAPLATDIVRVVAHYGLWPWLQFEMADPRPQGFAISLFLFSDKTGKGAFADGLITVKMYRIDRDEQRNETRTLVHNWQFTPEQAKDFRSHRVTLWGEGYGLDLHWPKELDLVNREIMVMVEFTRRDGHVISSGSKFLKVPDKVSG